MNESCIVSSVCLLKHLHISTRDFTIEREILYLVHSYFSPLLK